VTCIIQGLFPVSEVSYGLVVEGEYDKSILPEFVRRIVGAEVVVEVLVCGGRSRFRKLPGYLRHLQHCRDGRSVDKVLVVQDCDQRPLQEVEERLRQQVPAWASCFPRGVQVHGVQQTIESWLMADEDAINSVRRGREAKGRDVLEIREPIEAMSDPKTRFKRMLSQAGLPYTPLVCRQVAAAVDLDRLRRRCLSFKDFERKVIDC
jgi:hypothetical protein